MLPTAVAVWPDWPLFASVFGVAEEKGAVKDAGLLRKCQSMSLAVGGICKKVKCATVETESGDIGAGFMPCIVLGFALGESDVPRFR